MRVEREGWWDPEGKCEDVGVVSGCSVLRYLVEREIFGFFFLRDLNR